MGGTSSSNQTQLQTQSSTPWAAAEGPLKNILSQLQGINPNLTGTESGALDWLSQNGGSQFTGSISDVANRLLSGGGTDRTGMMTDANNKYQTAMDPFASGSYVDPNSNPALQKYLQVARDDVGNSVNSMFAGAGRDLSGAHMQAYGRGVGQAEAPILYDAYNQARGQQLGAIQGQFGAAQGTAGQLSQMDQTRLANMLSGVGAAGAATDARNSGPMMQLQAEAQRRNIPVQTLAQMMGIALPAASAFSTTNSWGKTEGTQTKSPAETAMMWSQAWKNMLPKPPGTA